MTISGFLAYVKQAWHNRPNTSTPLSAERLAHVEDGIKGNSNAIEKIAAAVITQILNDPDKIASMAALYAVNKKLGDASNLPGGAADVTSALRSLNSEIPTVKTALPIAGTITAGASGNICEWLALPAGTYIVFGKAVPSVGATFLLTNATTGTILAQSKDNGIIVSVVAFPDDTPLSFGVIPSSGDYNVYTDSSYFQLLAFNVRG